MYAGGRYVEGFMIPETVTLIEDGALECCNWLLNIRVEEKNPVYKSIDGNLYSKDGTKLIQYSIGKRKKHFRIPDSVVSIHCDAFSFCNLESIIIPKNVQIIESGSFEGCWRLTIYCEIESQPNNWDEDWNPDNRPVFWKCELKNNKEIENSPHIFSTAILSGSAYEIEVL